MGKSTPMYSLEDMVVHRSYGVGKIIGIETKPINGVDVECYKVKTENGVYWFPTGSNDNPRVHPVASKALITSAIEILRSAPQSLDNDPMQWKERIDNVRAEGDFLAISSLIRDLSGLKDKKKKLNRTQDQAFNILKERLLKEWAASLNVEQKSVQPKLLAYLQESVS